MDNRSIRDNRRNEYIELLRFVLCVMIFIHHSGHVTGGAVTLLPSGGLIGDAFFMLTGYYAVRHICVRTEKNKTTESSVTPGKDEISGRPLLYCIKYTLNKLIRLFPYMAFGTVIIYILEYVNDIRLKGSVDVVDITSRSKDMLIELLYLPLTGLMGEISALNYRNAPMWYLSALLIALPVVMYLCIRLGKVFKYILVWAVPVCLQIFMLKAFNGVLPWQQFAGPVSSGYIRGISSLLMGGGIYYVSEYIRNRYNAGYTSGTAATADTAAKQARPDAGYGWKGNKSKAFWVFSILEVVLLIVVFGCVAVGVTGFYELAALYVIEAMFMLSLSGITFLSGLSFKHAGYLGRLSLPIYCIHWGIYRWVASFFGYLDYRAAMLLTLVLCLITAVLLVAVLNRLSLHKKRA